MTSQQILPRKVQEIANLNLYQAGRTPQEAKIREEVRLTPMELDGPGSNWE
uniref:Uncharacterized protein n=1 Tax=Vitis vinifera TaxID=29760 RepID=F6HRR7_VITVI